MHNSLELLGVEVFVRNLWSNYVQEMWVMQKSCQVLETAVCVCS